MIDADYKPELLEMLDRALEGLSIEYGKKKTLENLVENKHIEDWEYEQICEVITQAKMTPLPPRQVLEGYVVDTSMKVGNIEVLLNAVIDPEKTKTPPFITCLIDTRKSPFPQKESMQGYDGYMEAAVTYAGLLVGEMDNLRKERLEVGGYEPLFTEQDVLPDSDTRNLAGELIVVEADFLEPGRDNRNYQVALALSGFGCNPEGHGRAVFSAFLWNNKVDRVNRPRIIGILQPEKYTPWITEKLQQAMKEHGATIEKTDQAEPVPGGKGAKKKGAAEKQR